MEKRVTNAIAGIEIYLFLTLLLFISTPLFAQYQHRTAEQSNAISNLISAVEKDPDNIKCNEAFIKSVDRDDPKLINQYDLWIKKFPKCAVVPFALGKALLNHDIRAKNYLLKAVTINPEFAEAWEFLSFDLSFEGSKQEKFEYRRKATIADPKNEVYAFYYADCFKYVDPVKYDSLMLNVTSRFPDTQWGANALYVLGSYPYNFNERTAYYEQLYAMYSGQQYDGFLRGMNDYFDYLLKTSPISAYNLALKMVLLVKVNKDIWKQKIKVARCFIEARNLIEVNSPAEAAKILNSVNLGGYRTFIDAEESLVLFKAEIADASKHTKSAYDSLAMFYGKQPSDRVFTTLLRYRKKLGLDSATAYKDIWKLREASAMPETNFTHESFPDKKQVSLSDYKGKVVLLTVWFPACGPCKEEFPHFENVLTKFSRQDVAYLAIDLENIQEDYISPVIKSNGYTFTPLRDNAFSKTGNLSRAGGAPQNFLFDQKGRLMFSNFRIGDDNERMLELMISELLRNDR